MGNDQSILELKMSVKQEQEKQRRVQGKFNEAIAALKTKQTGKQIALTVERAFLFKMGLAHLKKADTELHPLNVTFLTDNQEERNINLGGPNREFFTLLLNGFKDKQLDMFEGSGGYLLPTTNRSMMDQFYYFGKAVVLSLLSDGPGFPYFPPFIISFIKGREFMHELSTMYVINTYLLQHIEKLSNACSQEEIDAIIGDDTERFTDYCGWSRVERITMKNKLMYIQTLLQWDLIDRRKESLEQIKRGLNVLMFLDHTKQFTELDRFFLHRDKRATTAAYIKEKLIPRMEQLVTRNDSEKKTKMYTKELLRDLNDEEAAKLFQFITGLDDLPVHDFMMTVGFNRDDPLAELPRAITCLQHLLLPLGNKSKMELYSSFNKALTLGKIGFSE